MILVVGATGQLGSRVAGRLLADDQPVRALSRTVEKAAELEKLGAEVVQGDLRDPPSLVRACLGIQAVFDSAHAYPGQGSNNPRTVDEAGKRALVDSAIAAGVEHFVFTSIRGARPDHPVDFFRVKHKVEGWVSTSGMSYVILRPSAFMESWATWLGEPILTVGKALILGSGNNPINFISAEDVAAYAVIALQDPQARNQIVEIGGPENLTLNQFAEAFEKLRGCPARKSHVPLPVLRVMSTALHAFNPPVRRQIDAGILMDSTDQTFDPARTLQQFPMHLTRLEEFARAMYA